MCVVGEMVHTLTSASMRANESSLGTGAFSQQACLQAALASIAISPWHLDCLPHYTCITFYQVSLSLFLSLTFSTRKLNEIRVEGVCLVPLHEGSNHVSLCNDKCILWGGKWATKSAGQQYGTAVGACLANEAAIRFYCLLS